MKISIVTTVFNKKKRHVNQCVTSLLQQTLRREEYEIILVDDCSTLDETVSAIANYDRPGSRVKVVRHSENLGPNEARRTGVRLAEGDFVVFVDGDDMLTSDAIESLRMQALRTSADVIMSGMFRWNDLNNSFEKMAFHNLPLPHQRTERMQTILAAKGSWTMCGRLMRRSLLTDDIFDMPRLLHEDLVTFSRIMFAATSVSTIDRQIYYYRWSGDSITSTVGERHIAGVLYAIEDWVRRAREDGLEDDLGPSIAEGCAALLNTMTRRAIYSAGGSPEACLETLGDLWRRYQNLDLIVAPATTSPAIQFFLQLFEAEGPPPAARLPKLIEQLNWDKIPAHYDVNTVLKEGLGPSDIARRLKGQIVIICQVDYHFRNAAAFARALALRGRSCVVVDNSGFAAGGKRPVTPEDRKLLWRTQYMKMDKSPYGADWLATAKLVITYNDFNDDIHDALEYRRRLGLRTVCVIEGINDFLRVDFEEPRYLPYRRCDTVFLAGRDDERFFVDRETFVIGLPGIEKLAGKEPEFPAAPLAVLNLNFTYGVLERHRYAFLSAAEQAFVEIGWDWKVTKHPMDGSVLPGLPVSQETQYQLIDKCTVFVSRFATGILEALACGKPVIYFNPHGEKVEKFSDPMGAYEIATTSEELVAALKRVEADLAAGVDFRDRAGAFLAHHTGYDASGAMAVERFADAVVDIVDADPKPIRAVSKLFFERLEHDDAFLKSEPGLVFGDLDRRHYAQLEETDLVAAYFGGHSGVMVDVGANIGQSADTFLGNGWTVHAFEPDPKNRARLEELSPHHPQLRINAEAVSDRSGETVAFYGSTESTGISSLVAFTDGHNKICDVETVRLADYCPKHSIDHVDFLKIDVEGNDKFVLDGFDWVSDRPDVISVEFEDAKTLQNGYSTHDLANSLIEKGYTVYVSEWQPIERYGLAHDWRRLIRYNPELDLASAWGNLVAFLVDPGPDILRALVEENIRFAPKAASIGPSDGDVRNRQESSPKRKRRRRRRIASTLLLLVVTGLVVLPLVWAPVSGWAGLLWPAAGTLAVGAAAAFKFESARRRRRARLRARLQSISDAHEGRLMEEITQLRDELQQQKAATDKTLRGLDAAQATTDKTLRGLNAAQATTDKTLRGLNAAQATTDKTLRGLNAAQATSANSISTLGKRVETIGRPSATDVVSVLRGLRPILLAGDRVETLHLEAEHEHGHFALMTALSSIERTTPNWLAGKTLIEIGTTREDVVTQKSTEKLAIFTAMTDMRFITVDMDPRNTESARATLPYLNPLSQAINQKGEDYLLAHTGPIDVVYLDAFDFDHGMHSEERVESYRMNLGTTITDAECWRMHLRCAEILAARLEPGGLVAFDDTWIDTDEKYAGKGKLAVPYLLEAGYNILDKTPHTVVLQKPGGIGRGSA